MLQRDPSESQTSLPRTQDACRYRDANARDRRSDALADAEFGQPVRQCHSWVTTRRLTAASPTCASSSPTATSATCPWTPDSRCPLVRATSNLLRLIENADAAARFARGNSQTHLEVIAELMVLMGTTAPGFRVVEVRRQGDAAPESVGHRVVVESRANCRKDVGPGPSPWPHRRSISRWVDRLAGGSRSRGQRRRCLTPGPSTASPR